MNAEAKPGYKLTEAGVIPKDWELVCLKDLGTSFKPSIKAGPFGSALTKATYVSEGYKVYGQEQVIRGDHTYGDYFISQAKFNELSACSVSPGDILLSLVGTAGKLIVLPADAAPGVINPRLLRLSFDKNRVCPLFFKALFETAAVQAYLERYAQGGTMGVLNAGVLRPVVIALPSLKEQETISKALSYMDALISGLDQLIVKKRDIQQAAMQQLLTGQRRLPEFSGEWASRVLRDLVKTPITDGPHETPNFRENGIPFLSVNNIANNRIDLNDLRFISIEDHQEYSKKCRPQRDDLLLGKAASVGKVALVETDLEFNIWSPIALIRLSNQHDPRYFYFAFRSKEISRQIEVLTNSSSQGNIGMGDIERLKFRLPSLEEQTAIATILSDMDAELAALEARRDKARQLKQGMMQELLTGRIRLV